LVAGLSRPIQKSSWSPQNSVEVEIFPPVNHGLENMYTVPAAPCSPPNPLQPTPAHWCTTPNPTVQSSPFTHPALRPQPCHACSVFPRVQSIPTHHPPARPGPPFRPSRATGSAPAWRAAAGALNEPEPAAVWVGASWLLCCGAEPFGVLDFVRAFVFLSFYSPPEATRPRSCTRDSPTFV
jgi:hypothetical protein